MVEEEIYQLLKTDFKVHTQINKDDKLSSLGLDSLELILLIVKLESITNRNISNKEMEKLVTVNDVLLLAEEKLSEE